MDIADKIFNSSWMQTFFGHAPAINEFLEDKQRNRVFWIGFKFLNCLGRGVSQVAFANNPISGWLIIFALLFASPIVTFGGILAASVGILTALAFGLETPLIVNGLTTYNALLVGTVTTSLLHPLYGIQLSYGVWIFIVFGASLSVIMNSCVTNLLESKTVLLPPLTIAFNVIQLLIFTILMTTTFKTTEFEAVNKLEEGELEILKVFEGILLSIGQVYGVQNIWSSVLIALAISIYSPLHMALGFGGAALGTICGLFLGDIVDVYAGIWGYNGFLASVAISGIYFVSTTHSIVIAGVNVVSSALSQRAAQLAFKWINLPYLTIPYIITTLIFLQTKLKSGYPLPVQNITFAEKHLYVYLKSKGQGQSTKELHMENNNQI